MRIYISNGNGWQRKEAKTFITWYVGKYLGHHISKDLLIKVRLLPMLEDETLGATCESLDEYPKKQRNFIIEVAMDRGMKRKEFLTRIAHEMVHLKQYSKGELIDLKNDVKHKNRRYSEDFDYYQQPWEIEAFSLEQKLVKEFDREIKLS